MCNDNLLMCFRLTHFFKKTGENLELVDFAAHLAVYCILVDSAFTISITREVCWGLVLYHMLIQYAFGASRRQ